VTIDGINIQDNFSPNLLLLDQVAEMTISTSNANSTIGEISRESRQECRLAGQKACATWRLTGSVSKSRISSNG